MALILVLFIIISAIILVYIIGKAIQKDRKQTENKENPYLKEAWNDYCAIAGSVMIAIAFVIGLAIGTPQYIIERNNCLGGSSASRDTVSYNNGKINLHDTEYTTMGLICEEYRGINTGYLFKLVIRYGIIGYIVSSGIAIFIYYKKEEKKALIESSNKKKERKK